MDITDPLKGPRRWMAWLLGAASLAVAATAGAQGAGADWSTASGTPQATRYSALADITAANAGTLVEEFSFATGTRASHQGQPLVVGSRMYIVTPYPNKLIALDLGNRGLPLWTYDPGAREYARGVACCDVVNRGAAYADGKVVYSVLDGTVVAVDAITGREVWRNRIGNVTNGETLTGAPLIVNGKVIIGNAGGELGVRGWVQALSLSTGAVLWKAYSTGPDPDVKIGAGFTPFYAKDRGTNLGVTTWPGTMWQQGGSTSWAWMSYDPGLNLLYYGTGNPGVWNPDMRPGDNKWGASIFARNPDTGQAVWAYQLTPHDAWDYDAVNESIVVDLPTNGGLGQTRDSRSRTRKVIVHFNKNGFAYTIDRATGEVLVAKKFGEVNWADRIDLATGQPIVNPDKDTHEGVITTNLCPSAFGVKDFEPAAYSHRTNLFYVPAINLCSNFEPLRAVYIAGTPFMGADLNPVPGPGGFLGELIAWDAVQGTRRWAVQEPLPLYGGVLATAGDLVFYGTLDGKFKAVNAVTGALVFSKQLECGIVGNPISYTAPDGKQRVAVYTGIGWLAGGLAGAPCPALPNGDRAAPATSRGTVPLPEATVNKAVAAAAAAPTSGMLHVFKLP